MEEIILEDKQAMIFLNNLGSSTFDPFCKFKLLINNLNLQNGTKFWRSADDCFGNRRFIWT